MILSTYLTNNKYECNRRINLAIRNINQELEKEINKLFKSDEYRM